MCAELFYRWVVLILLSPVSVPKNRNNNQTTIIPFIFSNFEALRCSMLPYADQQWMENIPLYAVEAFFSKEVIGTEV